jgi:ketosteroid isomerase-like protein
MKRVALSGSIVVLIAALAACAPAEQEEDVVPGIDELRDRFVEAYNRHDARAVAELYAADAVFVNPQGDELAGRDEIQRALGELFTQARPRLSVAPIETDGEGEHGWELGSYQLDLQPMPGQPLPGEAAQPGAAPLPGEPLTTAQPAPPATTAQPGQPGQPGQPVQPGQPGTTVPVQPPVGAPLAEREEGHYLIVVVEEDDRWLIRAHVAHAHGPSGAMAPPHPAAVPPPTTLGVETPLPPAAPRQPAVEDPVRPETETAPPPPPPPGDETILPDDDEDDEDDDDLEPPPGGPGTGSGA